MNSTLIGYFPKRRAPNPEWIVALGVEEICSVSSCLAKAPTDWIKAWQHNEPWVFSEPPLAWSVVPSNERNAFELYAFRILPIQFNEGSSKEFLIPKFSVAPADSSFASLGYDVVCRSEGTNFGCSPLSCNGLAQETSVNRYCLLNDVESALAFAATLRSGNSEPGPYFIVEVLRQDTTAI